MSRCQTIQTIHAETADPRTARRLARLLDPAPVFRAYRPGSPGRAGVEDYIARRFFDVHGASINEFMPVLLTMGCHGTTSAAAGIRAAGGQTLFLEHYLENAVEQAVSAVAGAPVRRGGIAEIGNLVATRGGASYLLFMVLTAVLDRAGFEWVVFTATPQVQRALSHLGLETHRLCKADPGRLAAGDAERWGRYYANGPQVVTGDVSRAVTLLNQRKLPAGALALFSGAIETLATSVRNASLHDGTLRLSA